MLILADSGQFLLTMAVSRRCSGRCDLDTRRGSKLEVLRAQRRGNRLLIFAVVECVRMFYNYRGTGIIAGGIS